jgi:anaerobic selenocysteine-containing dehydrogenase
MNPEDLADLGIAEGDVVEIHSNYDMILGVVEIESDLRRDVLSMAHGFGDAPGHDEDVYRGGSNTGRLTDSTVDFERYTGLPRMSAIPVKVCAHRSSSN